MYSSSVKRARALDVWGVRPVEVREAAAWPVVWREALWGFRFVVWAGFDVEGLEGGLLMAVDSGVEDWWRYLPTWGFGVAGDGSFG